MKQEIRRTRKASEVRPVLDEMAMPHRMHKPDQLHVPEGMRVTVEMDEQPD